MKKDKLWAKFKIHEELEGWRNTEGGVDEDGIKYVLNIIDQLDEPEVLSQDWIDEHAVAVAYDGIPDQTEIVYVDELENLIVPKKDLPVIPKYVAEWIEEVKPDNSLRVAFEYIARRKADDYDDPLAFWIEEGNSETFARAWLDGYEVEEEILYYALIKGHELADGYDIYWNCDKSDYGVFVSRLHPPHDNFITEMSKEAWNELGINDSNADFVKVDW